MKKTSARNIVLAGVAVVSMLFANSTATYASGASVNAEIEPHSVGAECFAIDQWGYIDYAGGNEFLNQRFVYANQFDYNGIACVQFADDNQWGYINLDGEEIFNQRFVSASVFNNGIARVQLVDGKWGYITHDDDGGYYFDTNNVYMDISK